MVVLEDSTARTGLPALLLGNEAVVRGALEAGVSVAATYPGTPSSEIGDTFWQVRKQYGFHFEYSANEKVALEVAAAAAASGLRSIVSMKHVGLNVAADSFVSTGYVGVRGGMVIVVADDPSMHSSQNEQDSRYYARLANLPMLEPGTPQEALDYTREAFELSEQLELPVMVRLTTRVSHTRGPVYTHTLGTPTATGHFDHEPGRFVPVPANARKGRVRLIRQYDAARQRAETHRFNRVITGAARVGVIASGAAGAYAQEIRDRTGVDYPLLLLGFSHPLPERLVQQFGSELQALLVVEETEPVMEREVKAALFDAGVLVRVYGRRSGHVPRMYELSPAIVQGAVERVLTDLGESNQGHPSHGTSVGETGRTENDDGGQPVVEVPARNPVLCPGCPHRHTYYAAKRAVSGLKRQGLDPVFPSDIGCYSLGVAPPYELADFVLSMGSSVGTAGGFAVATDQPVVAFIGDSTFFHAGLPALASAVHNRHNFTLVILDNRTTAMTGHQPHPGTGAQPGKEGGDLTQLSLADIARGMGVSWVREINPNDLRTSQKVLSEAVRYDGVAVVISRSPCVLLDRRPLGKTYRIDSKLCTDCGVCTEYFGCPAIARDDDALRIDTELCNSCGVCQQVCGRRAIEEVPM